MHVLSYNVGILLLVSCLLAGGCSPAPPATSADTVSTPATAAKIAASLRHTVQRLRADGITAANAVARHAESYSTSLVQVDVSGRLQAVVLLTRIDDDVQTQLEQRQVQLEHMDVERRLIQGWIPFEQLEAIAVLPFVRYIQPPSYAVRRSSAVSLPEVVRLFKVAGGYAAAQSQSRGRRGQNPAAGGINHR